MHKKTVHGAATNGYERWECEQQPTAAISRCEHILTYNNSTYYQYKTGTYAY